MQAREAQEDEANRLQEHCDRLQSDLSLAVRRCNQCEADAVATAMQMKALEGEHAGLAAHAGALEAQITELHENQEQMRIQLDQADAWLKDAQQNAKEHGAAAARLQVC